MRTTACLLFIVTALVIVSLFSGGCAQIGMPVGGPRDTIPPVLIKATPPDSTTGFKGNKISFTFDEYIQLDNPTQNVIVSPMPKKNPFIDFKLKTVTIKLFDTLKSNTTYSFQFGNSLKDLNEGNPLNNFSYVFSTGKFIDSLKLAGDVILAQSGTVDTTITVILYKDLSDSAVIKHRPDYITRLDKNGHFQFRFLGPGEYHIFALKDDSRQYMYTSPQQLFAFADSSVNPSIEGIPLVHLYAFQKEEEKPKAVKPKAGEPLRFGTSITNKSQDLLSPLNITFNYPVEIDTSKIELTDTLHHRLPGFTLSMDSTRKMVTLQYPWKGGENYNLIIAQNAAKDSLNQTVTKSDTVRFHARNETEYGSLKLNFKNLAKYKNPVLQLVNDKNIIQTFPLTGDVFDKKLIEPGTYHIQILEDLNKNGKWDTGDYIKKIQPEKVHRITETVSVRANWDNERDVTL